MLFSDFLYRGAHHFQKQFVNAAGIPVFPEQGVPQPVQALDYEGGFLRRICDKVFLFLHLACLLCASIIYGGEDSRKCAIFRLGLSHEAPTLLDFFGEIYSSAAKNLDFMRVCESVVMNIGTKLKESEPISNRRWVRILCLCRTLRPSPQRRLPPAAVRAFRFRYSVKRRRALKITCGAIIFQPFPFAEHRTRADAHGL